MMAFPRGMANFANKVLIRFMGLPPLPKPMVKAHGIAIDRKRYPAPETRNTAQPWLVATAHEFMETYFQQRFSYQPRPIKKVHPKNILLIKREQTPLSPREWLIKTAHASGLGQAIEELQLALSYYNDQEMAELVKGCQSHEQRMVLLMLRTPK